MATHQQYCVSGVRVGWRLWRLPLRGPRGSGIRVAAAAGAAVVAPQGTGACGTRLGGARELVRAVPPLGSLCSWSDELCCLPWLGLVLGGGTAPTPLQTYVARPVTSESVAALSAAATRGKKLSLRRSGPPLPRPLGAASASASAPSSVATASHVLQKNLRGGGSLRIS